MQLVIKRHADELFTTERLPEGWEIVEYSADPVTVSEKKTLSYYGKKLPVIYLRS